MDLMFDIPSMEDVVSVTITEKVVKDGNKPLMSFAKKEAKKAKVAASKDTKK